MFVASDWPVTNRGCEQAQRTAPATMLAGQTDQLTSHQLKVEEDITRMFVDTDIKDELVTFSGCTTRQSKRLRMLTCTTHAYRDVRLTDN